MLTLQQQKDQIDTEAQRLKDEADQAAVVARQAAVDAESKKIRDQVEYDVAQIQSEVQK